MPRSFTSHRALLVAVGILAVGAAVVSGVLATRGGDDDTMVFMAGGPPQASLPFVAAYVAEAQGFFAEEGLRVRIEHAGELGEPSGVARHLQQLEDEEVDFTTGRAAEVIALRDKASEDASPVVAIALFGQRGDTGYLVSRGANIASPANFAGKVVGASAGVPSPELQAMLEGAGLRLSDVLLETVGPNDVSRLLIGEVDVYPAFIHELPDTLRRQGHDVSVLDPADFGVPTLGLALVTRRDLLQLDPELVARFTRAMLRGARYAAEHIDEAIDVTLVHALGTDPDHESVLLESDLAAAEREDGIGRADADQWQALIDLMARYGAVAHSISAADVFDGSIADGIYERAELR